MAKSRRNILIAVSLVYITGLTLFTTYWGNNFSKSVNKKGEEFNLFLIVLIASTYLLYLFASLANRRIKIMILIFLPLLSVISVFFLGLILFVLLPLDGTSKDIMSMFFCCYAGLNLFGLFIYQKQIRLP